MGAFVVWRAFFGTITLVLVMLGAFQWEQRYGASDAQARSAAMAVLVTAQCFYCVNCRYETRQCVSLDSWVENPWVGGMVALNMSLQCLLTYVPGLNVSTVPVFNMPDGVRERSDWLTARSPRPLTPLSPLPRAFVTAGRVEPCAPRWGLVGAHPAPRSRGVRDLRVGEGSGVAVPRAYVAPLRGAHELRRALLPPRRATPFER